MVFEKGQSHNQPKPKEKSTGCVVDVRKTKTGKRITFKGHCSKEELALAKDSDSFDD